MTPPRSLLAISQLAWPKRENACAFKKVRACGYSGIEIVPGKIFDDWADTSEESAAAARKELEAEGLGVPAMQGLFFGLDDVHLFQGERKRQNLIDHILRCASLADNFGAKALVFGAPKLRDPQNISLSEAQHTAVAFFSAIGEKLAKTSGACMTLEPVAPHNGGTFLRTHAEVFELIKTINHPRIRMQFDLGCWITQKEDRRLLSSYASWIGHSHISAPDLGRIVSATADEARLCLPVLWSAGFQGSVSIEMLDVHLGGDWATALYDARPQAMNL